MCVPGYGPGGGGRLGGGGGAVSRGNGDGPVPFYHEDFGPVVGFGGFEFEAGEDDARGGGGGFFDHDRVGLGAEGESGGFGCELVGGRRHGERAVVGDKGGFPPDGSLGGGDIEEEDGRVLYAALFLRKGR